MLPSAILETSARATAGKVGNRAGGKTPLRAMTSYTAAVAASASAARHMERLRSAAITSSSPNARR
jgi:hypothetical protein